MQLDYLFGRLVESVEENADGWQINLESNGSIYCHDAGYPMPAPPMLTGLAFTASERAGGQVQLYFGSGENPHGALVSLPVDGYAISDDTYTQGEVVNPEVPEPVNTVPLDPEALRQAQSAEAPDNG